jgi:transposase
MARKLFGKKSEKLDPAQLRLALDLITEAVELSPPGEPLETDAGEAVPARPRKKGATPHGRRKLPKELPRRRVVVDLPEAEKHCSCGHDLVRIGESVHEKVDFVPASYTVVETVLPKYTCPKCHDGVISAEAPPQAVEKGLAAEGFIAHVVVSKYADHLPLHRQSRILAREGLDFPRSTLCDLVAQAASALQPIADELRRQVLASGYVQTDDTSIVVLEPDASGSIKGRVWTYLDPLGGRVVFDATRTHVRVGVEDFLAGYRGFLQADAYKGYDTLFRDGTVVEVACWAHARRRFVQALEGGEPRAAPILTLVLQLYRVEHDGAELSYDERRSLRQKRSVPILAQIDAQRKALAETVLPKSPLGDALRYLDNQWTRSIASSKMDACAPTTMAPRASSGQWPSAARTGSSLADGRRSPRRRSLFPGPVLLAGQRRTVRLSQRCPGPRRHPSSGPRRRPHAEGLGQDLRRSGCSVARVCGPSCPYHVAPPSVTTLFTGRLPLGTLQKPSESAATPISTSRTR